ncbi:hypothetical protein Pmar_PMAR010174 [Perkinsus marinus ATCC 50983]|uniref:Uncharacterized protein n=1 Tax=Perkinsus marinus (strain ATCC 50983 / TXsc) TaxID=423536 RepID=C5K513_PERM5|nr:hypothetical protein Pmar_PMAR010174 [Perkinsus marinus ATCC 50983]EER20435.1 hypothetical protein Pmar_PMAR010174 [Perkinsus marinus ATCC 50983]|eukprot:XP_002788639.1 hypothetical protein Pmar_PMAR010174 [Perkinsus marinus ATCC 50983]
MTARFWKAQSKRVARALWHKEGTEDINKKVYVPVGIPYTEEESIMIDNWAKSASVTSTPLVRMHPQTAEPLATNSPKVPITRGWSGVPAYGDTAVPVTDLVICIHGIGEHLWSQQAYSQPGLVEQCRGFRSMVNEPASGSRIE